MQRFDDLNEEFTVLGTASTDTKGGASGQLDQQHTLQSQGGISDD